MPRGPRPDAPGVLHHVMVRGIERRPIFRDDRDRGDFVGRLAPLTDANAWEVYAWALLPNHLHLLVRTGRRPLARTMGSLLAGYAGGFNRRHTRHGHLFQNRYKSIVVEEDPYLLEVSRYIHLNPLRAGLVRDLAALDRYRSAGHSVLLGKRRHPWQAAAAIWGQFGRRVGEARQRYRQSIAEEIAQGRRPDLLGGGLRLACLPPRARAHRANLRCVRNGGDRREPPPLCRGRSCGPWCRSRRRPRAPGHPRTPCPGSNPHAPLAKLAAGTYAPGGAETGCGGDGARSAQRLERLPRPGSRFTRRVRSSSQAAPDSSGSCGASRQKPCAGKSRAAPLLLAAGRSRARVSEPRRPVDPPRLPADPPALDPPPQSGGADPQEATLAGAASGGVTGARPGRRTRRRPGSMANPSSQRRLNRKTIASN